MAILEVDFFLFWGLMVSDIHRRKEKGNQNLFLQVVQNQAQVNYREKVIYNYKYKHFIVLYTFINCFNFEFIVTFNSICYCLLLSCLVDFHVLSIFSKLNVTICCNICQYSIFLWTIYFNLYISFFYNLCFKSRFFFSRITGQMQYGCFAYKPPIYYFNGSSVRYVAQI